tara:strand:- start:3436 stop:3639 length:204 start_codon:yes stop_codon:yes gene_type:complete
MGSDSPRVAALVVTLWATVIFTAGLLAGFVASTQRAYATGVRDGAEASREKFEKTLSSVIGDYSEIK